MLALIGIGIVIVGLICLLELCEVKKDVDYSVDTEYDYYWKYEDAVKKEENESETIS